MAYDIPQMIENCFKLHGILGFYSIHSMYTLKGNIDFFGTTIKQLLMVPINTPENLKYPTSRLKKKNNIL